MLYRKMQGTHPSNYRGVAVLEVRIYGMTHSIEGTCTLGTL